MSYTPVAGPLRVARPPTLKGATPVARPGRFHGVLRQSPAYVALRKSRQHLPGIPLQWPGLQCHRALNSLNQCSLSPGLEIAWLA